MKTSAAGRKAITEREGVRLKAYRDSVGIWTIGVGHTSAAGAPKVTAGLTITAAESDAILSRDLALFEKGVNDAVKVPLNQNEFDALVSLAFNIGVGAFQKSTLLKELNKGNRYGAASQFLRWDKAKGKTLKGLTTRRKAEREQFLSKSEPRPITVGGTGATTAPLAPEGVDRSGLGIAAAITAAVAGLGAWFASSACNLLGVLCQ